jgi:hypothetical protein
MEHMPDLRRRRRDREGAPCRTRRPGGGTGALHRRGTVEEVVVKDSAGSHPKPFLTVHAARHALVAVKEAIDAAGSVSPNQLALAREALEAANAAMSALEVLRDAGAGEEHLTAVDQAVRLEAAARECFAIAQALGEDLRRAQREAEE